MARLIIGSWAVRYPLGGNLSWILQWLVGARRLGHRVVLAEKSGYPASCFDPERRVMSDDCTFGLRTVGELLGRFGLRDAWCYVDASGTYHGMERAAIEQEFRDADLFFDMGSHGAWAAEASDAGARIFVDLEPGFRQMQWMHRAQTAPPEQAYDFFYTNGANIGTARSTAPAAGRAWRHLVNPVVVDLFPAGDPPPQAPFTTVMNWKAHETVEFAGQSYGQKDAEFEKFLPLPGLVPAPLEVAAAGDRVPVRRLEAAGWRVRDAHAVTASFDSYAAYIRDSRGEFSVCKQVFVATRSGWFSDRSAAYLASGRPVILQDTGFSDHIPCGCGLLAVRTVEEAAEAIAAVCADYRRHAAGARRIAEQYLDAGIVLRNLLHELGY